MLSLFFSLFSPNQNLGKDSLVILPIWTSSPRAKKATHILGIKMGDEVPITCAKICGTRQCIFCFGLGNTQLGGSKQQECQGFLARNDRNKDGLPTNASDTWFSHKFFLSLESIAVIIQITSHYRDTTSRLHSPIIFYCLDRTK